MHTSILCQSEDGLVTFHSAMGIVAILFNFGTGWIIVFQAQYSPLTMFLKGLVPVQVSSFFLLSDAQNNTELDWALKFLRQDTAQQPTIAQHSIAQHSTAQHSTAQHSIAQHRTGQDRT